MPATGPAPDQGGSRVDRAAPGGPSAGEVDRLARCCRAAPPRCGATRVIAIDGRSGAGKSVLAERIAARLSAGPVPGPPDDVTRGGRTTVAVVRLDDVYPGWDGLLPVIPLLRRWLLAPLASGRPAGYHRYDWTRGTFGGWQPVGPCEVLLLEGVGSGARLLEPYRSLLVWVQAPDGVRRERAIARDGEPFAREWDRWAVREAEYLARDDPRSRTDLTVRT